MNGLMPIGPPGAVRANPDLDPRWKRSNSR
jgi:hypothetical protein